GRQRHEDRLGAPAGLQAEQGAPVVDQVEFHVATAAVELEVPLPLPPGQSLATGDDGPVGGHVAVPHGAQEGEALLEAQLAELIEEEPPHAPGLGAVPEVEILVAPALEAGVEAGAERVAGGLRRPVPVLAVLGKGVEGGEVITAAKPPHR